jgi:putative ABC transport system permease protein
LGFDSPEQALGKQVHFPLWEWMKPDSEIIGIVEDYHHEAIKRPVMPTIFFLNMSSFQQVYYSVKLNAGSDPKLTLEHIEKCWHEVYPDRPFQFFFIDDFYDQQFKSELHFQRIFGLFAGVAILLSCLGIFGMTLFQANSRLKEISIRKILGASVSNLLLLLSGGHIKIIAVSTLMATPVIYFSAKSWLEKYPERINLSVVVFIIPIAIIVTMVIVTSFFQTFKAANTNPVSHLKAE